MKNAGMPPLTIYANVHFVNQYNSSLLWNGQTQSLYEPLSVVVGVSLFFVHYVIWAQEIFQCFEKIVVEFHSAQLAAGYGEWGSFGASSLTLGYEVTK